MEKKPLYTIGHGSRKSDDFLALLKEYDIEYLADVRSKPYSRFHPQFNQNALKLFLEQQGIRYVFMGDELGGRPADASCYDKEGKIDYEIVKTKDFFKRGIERLKTAYNKDVNLAIMCSERNPCECHRTRLIGMVLDNDNIILHHIDEHGKIKDHASVVREINKGQAQKGLFGNDS
ncbi:DUF488 domain-containing protein [Niastella caeni]|uniref:DUF488 domain-containing protein n=1 Tax=Niastella caeni TaxID=2569763 RepID=A0A4S8HSC0_9BACT|nr:DUF488 domain-containing protein [Niastella caeni]THU36002.1 DUF488 domain-containing protein [Niastella caeni]